MRLDPGIYPGHSLMETTILPGETRKRVVEEEVDLPRTGDNLRKDLGRDYADAPDVLFVRKRKSAPCHSRSIEDTVLLQQSHIRHSPVKPMAATEQCPDCPCRDRRYLLERLLYREGIDLLPRAVGRKRCTLLAFQRGGGILLPVLRNTFADPADIVQRDRNIGLRQEGDSARLKVTHVTTPASPKGQSNGPLDCVFRPSFTLGRVIRCPEGRDDGLPVQMDEFPQATAVCHATRLKMAKPKNNLEGLPETAPVRGGRKSPVKGSAVELIVRWSPSTIRGSSGSPLATQGQQLMS